MRYFRRRVTRIIHEINTTKHLSFRLFPVTLGFSRNRNHQVAFLFTERTFKCLFLAVQFIETLIVGRMKAALERKQVFGKLDFMVEKIDSFKVGHIIDAILLGRVTTDHAYLLLNILVHDFLVFRLLLFDDFYIF